MIQFNYFKYNYIKSDLKFVLETIYTRFVGSMLILMSLLLQMFTIVISPASKVDLVIQYLPHYWVTKHEHVYKQVHRHIECCKRFINSGVCAQTYTYVLNKVGFTSTDCRANPVLIRFDDES